MRRAGGKPVGARHSSASVASGWVAGLGSGLSLDVWCHTYLLTFPPLPTTAEGGSHRLARGGRGGTELDPEVGEEGARWREGAGPTDTLIKHLDPGDIRCRLTPGLCGGALGGGKISGPIDAPRPPCVAFRVFLDNFTPRSRSSTTTSKDMLSQNSNNSDAASVELISQKSNTSHGKQTNPERPLNFENTLERRSRRNPQPPTVFNVAQIQQEENERKNGRPTNV